MTKKTAVMHKPAIQLIYNQKRIIYAFNPITKEIQGHSHIFVP